MNFIPKSVRNLIDEFSKLPGIGPRSAQRLTFYLLKSDKSAVNSLGKAIAGLKENLKFCSRCFNIAETDPCQICSDTSRDTSKICVVEEPMDILALERTEHYDGLYHVLGGVISPLEGIGPQDLRIKELLANLKKHNGTIKEVVLATNPSLEGEATAMYIAKLIKPLGLKVTRIARGLPVGGDLEYADDVTLTRALEERRDY
jgi:recombination protein RecR